MPTNNATAAKPHRRVLLTQPSNEVEMPAAQPAPVSVAANLENDASAVRVIAYLTQEEGQKLDQMWLQMRGFGIRCSKADIVRAALLMTLENEEALREQLQGANPGNKGVVAAIAGRK